MWVPPGAAQRLLQEGRGWRAEGAQRAKEGWDGAGVGGAVTAIAPAGCGVREAVCGRLAVRVATVPMLPGIEHAKWPVCEWIRDFEGG